ncbi:MAG: thymidine kinase [Spirochaetales bacterium]|nr:thymidine kinase [Spirochaetales bacterium]
MAESKRNPETERFLKSLGFPVVNVHNSNNHHDFTRPSRRILVIGPMGSGKTEFSARVWRDSRIALTKSEEVADLTTTDGADRRRVFFVRSAMDAARFPEYPEDALAYRGGYERCGGNIAAINDSFELEELIEKNLEVGTWIIDEASFYDERIAYVVNRYSEQYGMNFIFPTLILNFRRDIFNAAARFLLNVSTDVFTLTAYCEHNDCIADSFYTYRYYIVDGKECPALYFDPLIVIGGDTVKYNPIEPNYCTRCDEHHYLPGKDYTFLVLKPLGEEASKGNIDPLKQELYSIKNEIERSRLYQVLKEVFLDAEPSLPICMNSLRVPCIAEKALMYLFAEENLLAEDQLKRLAEELELNIDYISKTLEANRRPVNFEQLDLFG